MKKYKNVIEYIDNFEGVNKQQLLDLQKLIAGVLKEGVSAISYGIPTYKVNKKNIIHFAGFKKHFGIYPGSGAILHFQNELRKYDTSKGTIKLPWRSKIPKTLIREIIKFNLNSLLK